MGASVRRVLASTARWAHEMFRSRDSCKAAKVDGDSLKQSPIEIHCTVVNYLMTCTGRSFHICLRESHQINRHVLNDVSGEMGNIGGK
jgi:hypothetical protein